MENLKVLEVPGVVSVGSSCMICSLILLSSMIISSSSSLGTSGIGVAPDTVIVLTATLSATTTVNVTVLVWEVLSNVKLVELAINDEIEGPVESAFVIVIVWVSVLVYPLWSLTVNV